MAVQPGMCQTWSESQIFLCVYSPPRQIGEIASVLSLEDWGPIGTQQIVVAPAAQESSNVSTIVDSKGFLM